jgi:hypothetical protein
MKLRKSDDEITFVAWAEERRLAAARLARHIEDRCGKAVPPILGNVRRSA